MKTWMPGNAEMNERATSAASVGSPPLMAIVPPGNVMVGDPSGIAAAPRIRVAARKVAYTILVVFQACLLRRRRNPNRGERVPRHGPRATR